MKQLLSPVVLLALAAAARADVKLPAFFSDHMVLQREMPVPVWGEADPGETVTVEFAGQRQSSTAGADGRWMVRLTPMAAGAEPRSLTARGKNTVTIQDVLTGEVWIASGQSNMGFSLANAHNAATEIPKADDAQLRFFNVKTQTAAEPQKDVVGKWSVSSPATAPGFSAVAWFFARELRAKLGCPVGVLQSAWGGTPAQAWLSMDALRQEPPLTHFVQSWEQALARHREVLANPQLASDYQTKLAQWNKEVRPAFSAASQSWNKEKWAGRDPGPKPEPAWPEPVNPDPTGVPNSGSRPSTPSVIYDAMIAPLVPYALRGVIWYQGEANGSAGLEYRTLFPRLIGDWRAHWGTELPFLYVQLPGWEHDRKPPEQHDWPWLREAQLMTLKLPRTGMAVTIDVGDPATVHPGDKLDVGQRLALLARKVAYGEKIVASGPLYRSSAVEGSAVRVKFDEVGGGLTIGQAPWLPKDAKPLPPDRLVGFTVAGDDRKWADADARIDGETVVVSSPQIAKPIAIRYAWANAPACNLYNREGLPASPFRTDDWH